MFTKSAIALAIIVSVTSGALAATTHRQYSPNSASAAFAATTQSSHGAKTFQDPMRPAMSWDAYGLRWD